MFKFITIFVLSAVLLSVCAKAQDQQTVSVISESQTNDGEGNFANQFETSNGIKVETEGHLKPVKVPTYDSAGVKNGEVDAQASVQTGSYSYTDPEGKQVIVRWTADENGFQPILEGQTQ